MAVGGSGVGVAVGIMGRGVAVGGCVLGTAVGGKGVLVGGGGGVLVGAGVGVADAGTGAAPSASKTVNFCIVERASSTHSPLTCRSRITNQV